MSDSEVTAAEEHRGEEHVHASIWPLVGAVGFGVALAGLVFHYFITIAGMAIIFFGLGGWLYQDAKGHSIGKFEEPMQETPFAGISNRKLGMWLFLASEIFFFSALIGGSLALRAQAGWYFPNWPEPGAVLNVQLTAVNTLILVTSSLTMVEALRGFEMGNVQKGRALLLATMLLGMTFLSIQIYEYNILFFEDHLTPWYNPLGPTPATYGTTFYVQTGFHGAHVTAGVVALGFLVIKAFHGKYSKENHEAVELVGLYWHFVDVVWIFLFTLVYLI